MTIIPYKCRCEALGENKRRGGRYKSINKNAFTIPDDWNGFSIYLAEGDSVRDVTAELKFGEINKIESDYDNLFLTARPEKHIKGVNITYNYGVYEVTPAFENGRPAKILAEIYDENLQQIESIDVSNEDVFKLNGTKGENRIIISADGECIGFRVTPEEGIIEKNGEDFVVHDCFKQIERPFECGIVSSASGLVKISKTADYDNNADYRIDWALETQTALFSRGTIENFDLPEIVKKLDINLPEISPFEYYIYFDIYKNGTKIDESALKMNVLRTEPEHYFTSEMPAVNVSENDENIIISGTSGEDFKFVLNKITGGFDEILRDGRIVAENCMFSQTANSVTVLDVNAKYVSLLESFGDFTAFIIIYGDGEIGIATIGDCDFKIAKPFTKILTFAEISGGRKQISEIPGDFTADNSEFLVADNDLIIKTPDGLDFEICENSIIIKTIGSASFVLRPIYRDEEDIVREARTLPAID